MYDIIYTLVYDMGGRDRLIKADLADTVRREEREIPSLARESVCWSQNTE